MSDAGAGGLLLYSAQLVHVEGNERGPLCQHILLVLFLQPTLLYSTRGWLSSLFIEIIMIARYKDRETSTSIDGNRRRPIDAVWWPACGVVGVC